MLITGPWQEASSNYSCLFDQISVPASLIQPGVLRCYCPGETGVEDDFSICFSFQMYFLIKQFCNFDCETMMHRHINRVFN